MQIIHTAQGLTLNHNGLELCIDFNSAALEYRRTRASKKNELIAKAVGIKAQYYPHVLDATAGLGRDAFILASLGCHVTLLEKNNLLSQLLDDALLRARQASAEKEELKTLFARMQFIAGDSIAYMKTLSAEQRPDVVYLDPMFPERKKSAAVKKSMQILQALHNNDDVDEKDLLDSALHCARQRVVVKRPRLAKPLTQQPASYSLIGSSNRFDVYLL